MTESVRKAQEHYFGESQDLVGTLERDALTEDEIAFIEARDSFYIATIGENGWPYIQHRGGRAGFLRVLNPQTLAFGDYRGNRQMLSTGNLGANNRVALFLMDYLPVSFSLPPRPIRVCPNILTSSLLVLVLGEVPS